MAEYLSIGVYVDGNSCNTTEGSREVVEFAVSFGMPEPAPFELDAESSEDAEPQEAEYWEYEAADAESWFDEQQAFTVRGKVVGVPPFTYWSWHNGDFGLWPDTDMSANDDVLVLGPKDTRPEFILDINERGNCTLYQIERKEVWACV